MSKTMGDVSSGQMKYWGDGIFTERITISRVEDFSNYPTHPEKPKNMFASGNPSDLCLKVFYESGGKERHFKVMGQFHFDEDKVSGKKVYKGWETRRRKGVAPNRVQSFLARMSPRGDKKFEINDDDTIPQRLLASLSNREVYILRYCAGEYEGKPSMNTYQYVQPVGEPAAEELLVDDFKQYPPREWDKDLYNRYSKAREESETSFNAEQYGEDYV